MTLRRPQKGFTIVELMIATAVFSTILIVVLAAITQIGRMYYKGLTNAKTQETARLIVDRVSQEIQYSSEEATMRYSVHPTSNRHLRCIGGSRFYYQLNVMKTPSNTVLQSDDSALGDPNCTVDNNDSASLSTMPTFPPVYTPAQAQNVRELLPRNMRIVRFDVTRTGDLYTIVVRVLYGESDLIETPGGVVANSVCRGSLIGTQFCSESELRVTVQKRL